MDSINHSTKNKVPLSVLKIILIGLISVFLILLCLLLGYLWIIAETENNGLLSQQKIVNSLRADSTLTGLLNEALTRDSVEFIDTFVDAHDSFLFFKSGYIISKTEKNALVVVCPTDTTYEVSLYALRNDKWNLIDAMSDLDAFPTQFDVIFDDYNFDGQTDLYIQVTASNGLTLSFGHLITIDPKTNKFELHKEARALANIKPDKTTKTVTSEGIDYESQFPRLVIFTHKWEKGQLETIR
jgi:hypothetical protein